MRSRALVLLALLSSGCGPTVLVNGQAFKQAEPKSLAVLPFALTDADAEERGALKVEALRRLVAQRLQPQKYLQLSVRETDRRLAAAGLDTPAKVARASYQALAQALGVDALLRGEITDLYNLEGVLIFRQKIEGTVRLIDAKTGTELFKIEHAETDTGGLVIGYSQSLEAIEQTMDNHTDLGFLRLAEKFADAVAHATPAPPKPAVVTPPRLGKVTISPSREGVLRAGDTIEIRVEAQPQARVRITPGHHLGGFPLLEEKPGLYVGALRIPRGAQMDEDPVVHVVDAFGVAASKVIESPKIRIDARPTPAPSRLQAKAERGKVVLTWSSERRKMPRYRVYGLDPRGIPTLLATVKIERAVVPVGSKRFAVAGYDGASLGVLAIVDRPKTESGPKTGGSQ